ncbi:hypothetical protein [Chitinibacter tainanensis]|uniref:hypothetical protein n=1 Tax=Chitinibacter tainanensis TaxID=230667 RepID=UPI00040AE989|nr:hypothetical protein [Chitinibacter tainanensis]
MKLLVFGATGAVGQAVLQQALADPRITAVIAPTRRALPSHTKLLNPLLDFAQLPRDASWWAADGLICALGTTRKIAGSPAGFVAVDRDLVLQVATQARQAGVPYLALNSSLGASLQGNLYLRTKAEAEAGVRALGFPRLRIVRPALIQAARTPPRRAEAVGLFVCGLLGPLIPRRYRPVQPAQIAAALLNGLFAAEPGEVIVESDQL